MSPLPWLRVAAVLLAAFTFVTCAATESPGVALLAFGVPFAGYLVMVWRFRNGPATFELTSRGFHAPAGPLTGLGPIALGFCGGTLAGRYEFWLGVLLALAGLHRGRAGHASGTARAGA